MLNKDNIELSDDESSESPSDSVCSESTSTSLVSQAEESKENESKRAKILKSHTSSVHRKHFSKDDIDTSVPITPLQEVNYDRFRHYKGSENAGTSSVKPKIASEFIPQRLRKETRNIMRQLHQSSAAKSAASHSYNVKCQCLPTTSHSYTLDNWCKSCAQINYAKWLAKMPIDCGRGRPASAKRVAPTNLRKSSIENSHSNSFRNVLLANMNKSDGPANVIYQPSGSTVVIEKHLK